MSQLARRENAPHRATFVTSLSRWYIRRLLGNLPPFHPCLSAERRPRICPLRDFATLRTYSPEIKARQALFAFLPVYPELVGVIGSRVPDYRGRFLRGVSSGHSVGQTVANSLKSHNHTQPTHTLLFRAARQHSPIRHSGGAIILFCGKSRSQRMGCWTIHHERRSGRAELFLSGEYVK